MTLVKIDVPGFLDLALTIPVIDVRSSSEFLTGHIPGALNIPLFDNEARAAVGKIFTKEGRIPAILEGLNQTGSSLSSKLEKALSIASNRKLILYCWRGGLRSEAMAWLFALGGIDIEVLDGGYKSYRHHVLNRLSEKRKMIVLGGMTGSSKTHILRYFKTIGQQVIDLEGLANHKGSAFGSLGQPAQPSTEYFANLLFEEWDQPAGNLPIWIEDESRNIGSVFIPDSFYLNMQDSPTIILMMDKKARLPRLIEEYSNYPIESLKASITKISKRIGGDNAKDAIFAIDKGDFAKAIEIVLEYYDKTYMYGLKKKENGNIIYINSSTENIETNAQKVIEVSRQITW